MARAALGLLEPQCWIVIFAATGAFCTLAFFTVLGAMTSEGMLALSEQCSPAPLLQESRVLNTQIRVLLCRRGGVRERSGFQLP